MLAVIFEVEARPDQQQGYLSLAAELRPLLAEQPGFISIERFQSLTQPGKILSLSFWQDDASVQAWRQREEHRRVQTAGREELFSNYRLRVAQVLRDYGLHEREQAPADSREIHEQGTAR
ncbi:antibiotic biosynthesis monooxygenase family protein [Ectopseudomonas guguanensis]|jgi:heme-degrading monooxygenase HmoA|uniref:antibiotic biosynthesis monooxygenase family protein n=1 Tax=Ectopseudomonas guguanensis TaxID=1198456 RepID=UPI002861F9CE|nr:antibiotic biosynthesis monooxygenase [Pseudomonas guguanensis]MDR8017434.1 antibiotic biosynthesis monooxygenase [Pseudomonas guguanensis]